MIAVVEAVAEAAVAITTEVENDPVTADARIQAEAGLVLAPVARSATGTGIETVTEATLAVAVRTHRLLPHVTAKVRKRNQDGNLSRNIRAFKTELKKKTRKRKMDKLQALKCAEADNE
ncbi:predicted protein [Histoplasma capsulatum var. duboisii H88]|uniref:Predicted protein n=1 Tax=Ajellomyces capsulatus (strain H88) TaxID=544711 RepID=F0UIV2_AJEC8|nr:predicted protein [Histoplasma capsulatum var. duboisii H88]